MKKFCSSSLALSLLLPALSSAATTSFEVNGLGADPLDGSAWGYRNDLQTGPQAFVPSADFVFSPLPGATSPPGVGYVPDTGGEGGLIINGNSSGGLRTASMSNFTGFTNGVTWAQTNATPGISFATSLGNIDYRWQKLTLNNSSAPNVKFQLWGMNGIGIAPTFLGSAVYVSPLANSATNTWITETDIQDVHGWFGSAFQGPLGYNNTLSDLLSNIGGIVGNFAIFASDVQVAIGSSGSGGTDISGAVDWISFDVGGGSFGNATIATNFIPEPTLALGGILCVLGLGIRRRSR